MFSFRIADWNSTALTVRTGKLDLCISGEGGGRGREGEGGRAFLDVISTGKEGRMLQREEDREGASF